MSLDILFFTDNFPPETNAAASRVFERALYWVRWGHRVTVITSAPNFPQGRVHAGYRNEWHRIETLGGIRVVRVKTFIAPNEGVLRRGLDFASYMVTAWIASLFERRPDVIVSTSPQFLAAVSGWGAATAKHCPFVFELGDLWPASIADMGAMRHGPALRALEKVELFLYRQSAAVIALTRSFKENLVSRKIPAEKIAVVINGVELSRWSRGPKDAALIDLLNLKDRRVVGYIGTHGLAHALENVIEAADLMREWSDLAFLFVGDGAAKAGLVEQAERRGLRNVVFVPMQPKDRVIDYWRLCDVALVHLKDIPVFETVIPSKIFEAMAMGLPILLAAPVGEAARIVEKAGCGVVVRPGDPENLAEAVRTLVYDQERLTSFARQSLEAGPNFTRERQARHMMDVLEAVVSGQPLPASCA